jgi:hypothetical protein
MLALCQIRKKRERGREKGRERHPGDYVQKQKHLDPGWIMHATSTVTAAALSQSMCMSTYKYLRLKNRSMHQ